MSLSSAPFGQEVGWNNCAECDKTSFTYCDGQFQFEAPNS